MKLDDKQKKWGIIGGAVIVCMILVLLIAGQFRSEPATAVQETAQADQTTVVEPMVESSEAVRETVKVETKAETTAAPSKGQTDETVQQIQPEVTKPAKPKDEDRHDPTKKPNGETVIPTNPVVAVPQPTPETEPPVVTEPQPVEQPTEPPTEAPTEATESAPQEGMIYVPGFGWVTPSGSIGRDLDSDGDINKQVGIMD